LDYFTPPPLENVPATTLNLFTNTSNASAVTQDDPVRAERAHSRIATREDRSKGP